MSTNTNAKKSPLEDWHKADIVAALHKAGVTLRQLSKEHGYTSTNTVANALYRDWPKGEQIIAHALGLAPEIIWAARYERRRENQRARNSNKAAMARNVKTAEAF